MSEILALYLGFGVVAGILSGLLGSGGGVIIVSGISPGWVSRRTRSW